MRARAESTSVSPFRTVIPPRLSEVTRAREFADEVGKAAGLSEDRIFDLRVVVSEATANAIEHATSEVEIVARLTPDRLIVEISNEGEFRLRCSPRGRTRRGMGLPLMVALADEVNVARLLGGKTRLSLTFVRESAQDVVEHRPSEGGFTDSEERLTFALEISQIGAWEIDLAGEDKYRNLQHDRIFGYESLRSNWTYGIFLDHVVLEDRPLVEEKFRAVRENRTGWDFECRIRRVDGEVRRIWTAGRHRVGPAGQVLLAGVIQDVTELKRTEEELRRKEEEARLLIRGAPAAVYEIDFRGPSLVSVNDYMCEQTGYSREELLQMSPFALLDEESVARFKERIHAARSGERPEEYVEYTVVTRDGRRIASALNTSLIYEDGIPIRALVVGHDVTERKRVQLALEQLLEGQQKLADELAASNAELQRRADELAAREEELEAQNAELMANRYNRSLIEASPDPLVAIGPDGKITDVNEATVKITGWERDSLIGSDFADYFTDPEKARQGYRKVFVDGAVTDYPLTIHDRLGRRTDVLYNASVYKDPHGKTLGVFAAARDITALKELDLQRDIATKLQHSLLDTPIEVGRVKFAHLYRSATREAWVGGDFFDVFDTGEGMIAFLIGDVCGHGVEAARVSVLVKDVVHAFAHQQAHPSAILSDVNEVLLERKVPGFVTVFLGMLDPEDGLVNYSCAGHPSPLLRLGNGEIRALCAGSIPLGVFPDRAWTENVIRLDSEDLVLLYTDGATEARHDGAYFGESRLAGLLATWTELTPFRLPEAILDEILKFSGGVLQDDIALLALTLGEPVESECARRRWRQERLMEFIGDA
ncbi:MAG: PAS domain S-box protein [Actinobacteria bacterium]|nr:PAS domain S-box protein [Actinomycetota bacterium]